MQVGWETRREVRRGRKDPVVYSFTVQGDEAAVATVHLAAKGAAPNPSRDAVFGRW